MLDPEVEMAYIMGLLWGRGAINTARNYFKIRINLTSVEPWVIGILKLFKNLTSGNFLTVVQILRNPKIRGYIPEFNLTEQRVKKFLKRLERNFILEEDSAGWYISDNDNFTKYFTRKQGDIENYRICTVQLNEFLTKFLRKSFEAERIEDNPVGAFNITSHEYLIEFPPNIIRSIVSTYDLPTAAHEIELSNNMIKIPQKITEADNREEKLNFLSGVADVCLTLDGTTPRGEDARISFNILNNRRDDNLYKITVQRTIHLCNFIQESIGIPTAANYIRVTENGNDDKRPHNLKYWVVDLHNYNFPMPLWKMKTHYQTRLNVAIDNFKDEHPITENLCPRDTGKVSIEAINRFLEEKRNTAPSLCRCIQYCDKLKDRINEEGINVQDYIEQIRRRMLEAQGRILP